MEKVKNGRPTKYDTHIVPYLDRLPKMKRQGMTDEQIAFKLGVNISSFKRYKKDNPALAKAIKGGRMELVEDLEDTLYSKALGGRIITRTKTTQLDKKIVKVETWKDEMAPDTSSLIFALKNIASEFWQDRKVVDSQYSSKELAELRDSVANFGRL